METNEEISVEPKEIENEAPKIIEKGEMKVPRAKIRVTSIDASPIRKITIRQSTESPETQQTNYEIVSNHCRSVQPASLHLSLANGLDPIGIELISSSRMSTPKASSEYSDKSDDILSSPKLNREMKNLQKSTHDSKILSDYLNTSTESPRRSRKTNNIPIVDPDENMEIEESHETLHEISTNTPETPVHDEIEGDSTLPQTMEPPEKLNKPEASNQRNRSQSQSAVRSRKKTAARRLSEELVAAASEDKDEEEAPPQEDEEEDMSEVSFKTNRSVDGRPVNPPPKTGWDSFCFKCHTDTAVLSLACSKCKCSYHRHCVRTNPIPKNVDEFVCPECREVENAESSDVNKYGHEKIDANKLCDMLKIILDKIRTYPDRDFFENEIFVKATKEPNQSLIVTQMTLKTLETRIKNRQYKVSEAFIHDVKQLEHNWNVVDRSKTKTLKAIMKYVNTEINELESCVFCYEASFKNSDWFVLPCKRPHLLIWAKLKGYPYWPAKVMSIDSRQQVDVRFFGAHDRAWVAAAHCILFCEKDPNKTKGSAPANNKNTSKTQKGIADAMKEKDDYIENMRMLYGFKYAPFKQQFDANEHQKQLEFMLPGLKTTSEGQNGTEKETEVAQKEKLTLKIIKGQSSNYQVEHKQGEHKQPEKEKPKLYKVMSRNDESTDMDQPGKLSLIIKRKSNIEQESVKAKRSRTSDNTPETPENIPSQSTKPAPVPRRSSVGHPQKHKKPAKTTDKDKSPQSELPPTKKAKHVEKQKSHNDEEAETAAKKTAETAAKKTMRRSRSRSVKSTLAKSDEPLLVPVQTKVPALTDEIHQMPENGQSLSRSQSTDSSRRTTRKNVRSRSVEPKKEVKPKRKSSVAAAKNAKRESVSRKSSIVEKPLPDFDPDKVIKIEPDSDCEEVVQRSALKVSDIPNLIQDLSGRKKLIVISTNDAGEATTSHQLQKDSRARKTFPNHVNPQQTDQNARNGNWMVCIPGSVSSGNNSNTHTPPASNRSTPQSDTAVSISPVKSNQRGPLNGPCSSGSRVNNTNSVLQTPFSVRRNSLHSSLPLVNGQRNYAQYANQQQRVIEELPRLVPRPLGVFANDGNSFSRDIGPVSRLFTDNAHRASDFFRNLIIESVSSFAPEVPVAENLMLRSENEKLQREMQVIKAECQQKMQELRREHQDEIDSIKRLYEDQIKNVQISKDQEKNRLINEIRHQCEIEKQRAIEMTRKETKKTTWCSNCTKEARFYCCWNTSYCSHQCQKTHWQQHQKYCSNKNSVSESPPHPAPSKQTSVETPVVATQSTSINTRPTLVLRAPQQIQMQQHHIIVPSNTINVSSQPVILGSHPNNKYRAFHSIIHDAVRDSAIPTGLIIKTIQRTESPNVNVISTLPMSESIMLHNHINSSTTSSSQD